MSYDENGCGDRIHLNRPPPLQSIMFAGKHQPVGQHHRVVDQ